MYKVAIVDDEQEQAQLLEQTILRYGREKNIPFQVEHIQDPVLFLEHYYPNYDVIFMDIDMPSINGMDVAGRLRTCDNETALVFCTYLAQYAVKGYEVGALDYIIKPVRYHSFVPKMDRIMLSVQSRKGQRLVVRSENKVVVIDSRNLLYVEIRDHYLMFWCTNRTQPVKVRGTMAWAKEQLRDLFFEECNKCYLVNLEMVSMVEGHTVRLDNGEELSMSRSKKSGFLQRLAAYYGNWKVNMGRLQS